MQCELLSERPFSGQKYSRADSSAVRIAVRKASRRAIIQQDRQHSGAPRCQHPLKFAPKTKHRHPIPDNCGFELARTNSIIYSELSTAHTTRDIGYGNTL